MLSILKKLRVTYFAAQTILKPHQAMLVKWFEKFSVSDNSSEDDGVAARSRSESIS